MSICVSWCLSFNGMDSTKILSRLWPYLFFSWQPWILVAVRFTYVYHFLLSILYDAKFISFTRSFCMQFLSLNRITTDSYLSIAVTCTFMILLVVGCWLYARTFYNVYGVHPWMYGCFGGIDSFVYPFSILVTTTGTILWMGNCVSATKDVPLNAAEWKSRKAANHS